MAETLVPKSFAKKEDPPVILAGQKSDDCRRTIKDVALSSVPRRADGSSFFRRPVSTRPAAKATAKK